METEGNSGHAEHRNRTIRGAILTSLLSKSGTLVLRLVSIPVAIRVLGMEMFGVYATLLIVVQMMDILHVGIGPSLTQKLSKAVLEKDREKEAKLFTTSVVISSIFTLVIAAILVGMVCYVPIADLFGPKYGPFADTMQRACLLGILIIGVEVICLVPEKARDGYMETRFTNGWGAAGNFAGAILLLIGIWFQPNIEFLLIAVNGSVVAAKLANAIHLVVQRPYLLPRISTFEKTMIRTLMSGALIFTMVYGLSGISEYNIVSFLIGRFLGPEQTANYSVLVTLHISLVGIVSMFTIPLWPAVIDAFERGDYGWVAQGAARLRLLALGFGTAVFVGMAALGSWFIYHWIGDSFTLGQSALGWYGLYFALHLWRHANQILCLGVSLEKKVATVVVLEVGATLLATVLLLRSGHGIEQISMATCGCLLCFSGWIYPLMFNRALAASRHSKSHVPLHAARSFSSIKSRIDRLLGTHPS